MSWAHPTKRVLTSKGSTLRSSQFCQSGDILSPPMPEGEYPHLQGAAQGYFANTGRWAAEAIV